MQLSLFSVSYAGFWGQHALTLDAFCDKAAALGYEAVMIAAKRPHLSPLDTDEARLAQMRSKLAAVGLTCEVIAAYTDLAGGAAGEVPHLEFQIAYLESCARIAQGVGAGVVRMFTAYETPQLDLTAAWQRVVTGVREAADRAAAYGVTLAIQNHHDVGVHTRALLELLHDIDRPNVKLGFDAWSPALRGEDLYQAALAAGPYTVITTNADYVRLPRFQYRPELINYQRTEPDLVRAVPFGDGDIDYLAFFNGLLDGGFDGIASYEACSPLRGGGTEENVDRCASRYVEWMRQHVLPAED